MDGRFCAATFLDEVAFGAWLAIEGPYDYSPGFDPTYADHWGSATKRHDRIRNELREAGRFDPQHHGLLRPYLGRHLKEGAIFKVPAAYLKLFEAAPAATSDDEENAVRLRALLPLLPAGTHYTVSVRDEYLVLFFGRKGRSLRLVALFGSGG